MRRILAVALLAALALAATVPVSIVTAGKAEAARAMKPTGERQTARDGGDGGGQTARAARRSR